MLLAGMLLSGCGLSIPSDPNGTMDRVEGAVLRAGASVEEGLVEKAADGGAFGPLADLVEAFAEEHGAEVEWTFGSEESLVEHLEQHRIDLAVGGMTADTPWSQMAGTTRGYDEVPGAEGREIVMLVPLGENELVYELESFLDRELS
ncbi:hypothetical protein F8O04_14235 [Pseudoclavibacter endophyticus]|uniref:Transporter substrate-binding domain-containing protein n=2 Tax=Pseudoclavibacter endophyticus TaxID=1778590 RepID=A0A6H9WP05_9MICO|nr:hypothetical protein F8O04_14235 [Pseudoclavibacter endophyticus]